MWSCLPICDKIRFPTYASIPLQSLQSIVCKKLHWQIRKWIIIEGLKILEYSRFEAYWVIMTTLSHSYWRKCINNVPQSLFLLLTAKWTGEVTAAYFVMITAIWFGLRYSILYYYEEKIADVCLFITLVATRTKKSSMLFQ